MANNTVFTDTDLNSASDMQIRDMLFERGLHIPLTEDNKLIRKHAVRLLMDWRQDHAIGYQDDSRHGAGDRRKS